MGALTSLWRSFGWWGVVLWATISTMFTTVYVGEYLERPHTGRSYWKAAMQVRWTVDFSENKKKKLTFTSKIQNFILICKLGRV